MTKVIQKFKILIDQAPFDVENQFITGAEIRALGNIPADYKIFLKVNGPGNDREINDMESVDLGGPGAEHFYSKDTKVKVVIIVNGTPKNWDKNKISFKEVVILAFGAYSDKPTMVYTVAYEDGPPQNPEGSMVKDSVVHVKDKMIFHATCTDKS